MTIFRLFFAAFLGCAAMSNGKAYTQIDTRSSSSEILHDIKKLGVFGKVLYIAAHPDDENTRLLSYLANELRVETAYLSLTRGDGGQNLIGDEQGIDLGLIRTRELLAARGVDGARQFFTRAYDFGYSKNPREALKIWNHEEILSDVVSVIRAFRPDVIIARFPATAAGGHGHHTASAMLAAEAFDAAADAKRFPGQIQSGLKPWQAKRLLWNTYNFGNNNTIRPDQFQIDCGEFNSLLGLGYGEMAARSRSQHRSQGFGVAAQRGEMKEFFETIKGSAPVKSLLEDVEVSHARLKFSNTSQRNTFGNLLNEIEENFSISKPQGSVSSLVQLRKLVAQMPEQEDVFWKGNYRKRIDEIITRCAGIYFEMVSREPVAVRGDSATFIVQFIDRTGTNLSDIAIEWNNQQVRWNNAPRNELLTGTIKTRIAADQPLNDPYWIREGAPNGHFTVSDLHLRTKAVNEGASATVRFKMQGEQFEFQKPLRFKYTDPVKGEIYQPLYFTDAINMTANSSPLVWPKGSVGVPMNAGFTITFNTPFKGRIRPEAVGAGKVILLADTVVDVPAGAQLVVPFGPATDNPLQVYHPRVRINELPSISVLARKKIAYDHIPEIQYHYRDSIKVIRPELKIGGARIGYIPGAGDKIPEALSAMGYRVTVLSRADITRFMHHQFDAIVTGVRAYNVHPWLDDVYPFLMDYVENGGVLLVQYNTNNNIGKVRSRISPYPFVISRSRVTDETAPVTMLNPDHRVWNYPNKITQDDFDGWVQERSVYSAEQIAPEFSPMVRMRDPWPEEKDQDGALIIANYGKGKFIYTGLSLFRQLPAGVPGAYRLLANLLAK